MKAISGALSGDIGSVAGNSFDVIKTLMMANEGVDLGISYYWR